MRIRRRVVWVAALLCMFSRGAAAQTWTAPRTWVTGEQVTASIMNTHIRDNELVLRAGGFAVTSQAIGDLLCASSTTQFARLADVATGQVLKSGGVGACPAYGTINVAFLSDGTNVALLNANNTFNVTGAQNFGAGGSGSNSQVIVNGSDGVGGGGFIQWKKNGTIEGFIGPLSAILGSGTSDDIALYAYASAGIQWFTNNSTNMRFGINSAGDFTVGSSNHLFKSVGTPNGLSNTGGTSATFGGGSDYGFFFTTVGGPNSVSGNFGHTWSNAPTCVAQNSDTVHSTTVIDMSTTTTTWQVSAGVGSLTARISVLCSGY